MASRGRSAIWECPACLVQFESRANLRAHIALDHDNALPRHHIAGRRLPRRCVVCSRLFHDSAMLQHHQHTSGHWGHLLFPCGFCHRRFDTQAAVAAHVDQTHSTDYQVTRSAFGRQIEHSERIFEDNEADANSVDQIFAREEGELMRLITASLHQHQAIRVSVVLSARMVKYNEEGVIQERIVAPARSRSHQLLLYHRARLSSVLNTMRSECSDRIEEIQFAGSGYSLERIVGISVSLAKMKFSGGYKTDSFTSKLTPRERRHCIDVEAHIENGCLFSAVAQAFLRPRTDLTEEECAAGGERYQQTEMYVRHFMHTDSIPTPTPLVKLKKFEKENARAGLHFSLNVFMAESGARGIKTFFPVYIGEKREEGIKIINLLLVRSAKTHIMHFMYIQDFDELVKKTVGVRSNQHTCFNCVQPFSGKKSLQNHQKVCLENNPQSIVMPDKGNDKLKFTAYSKQVEMPIIGFCDFEASLKHRKIERGASTTELSEQVPTTFSILFVSSEGEALFEKVYSSDENLLDTFYATLFECDNLLMPLLSDMAHEMPQLTPQQQWTHDSATICYLCQQPFSEKNIKVLDHSHSSLQQGKFLGSAHQKCNLRRVEQSHIPIFVHNFSSYDCGFIMQGLANSAIAKKVYRLEALPLNTEKFKTLRINNFNFLDSIAFLNSSLATLVDELRVSQDEFTLLDHFSYCGRQITASKELLLRKSVYPYDWAESIGKLRGEKYFPPPDAFQNVLTESEITPADYQHGLTMYESFACENFLEYCEIYCLLDTYLLAQVMIAFRKRMFDEFQLDCAHYLSAPMLAFDIMLKTTGVTLELLKDPDMLLLIEKNLRGGVSFVGTRHVTMPDNFDAETTDECLCYLDVVNLYGRCMHSHLPVGDFRWLDREEIDATDWLKQDREQSEGYFVECDLFVPPHLHAKFSAMPLAPEKYEIHEDEMSLYSRECHKIIGGGNGRQKYSSEKLCGTLHRKENYLSHYVNLRHYLEQGLILEKVHRVIAFKQAPFLRDYITLMTEKRKQAKTEFEKSLIKICINSIYGKCIQGLRDYMTVKFVTKEKWLNRYLSDPCYSSHQIIGENCVAFFRKVKVVQMCKPYAVGFSILELSKNHMATLYYNYIQPQLGGYENVDVVMSDTDSYILHIKNHTKNAALAKLKHVMDFSNYPHDHPLYDGGVRKMIPGFFKDENPGRNLIEICALRSKCYIARTECNLLSVRCKGVSKRVVKNFTMQSYKACIDTMTRQYARVRRIQLKKQRLSTIELRKVALSSFDEKRHLYPCGIHSVPYNSIHACDDICPRCDRIAEELR